MKQVSTDIVKKIRTELNELDQSPVQIDGMTIKPSQCYRFSVDPMHVLFNTNCPDTLRKKVEAILSKYLPHESSTQ